jgi:hypothetical protein
MTLTDDLIEAGVHSVTGFITAKIAQESGRSIGEVMECFLASKAYEQLADKETGLYWDSIDDTLNAFLDEHPEFRPSETADGHG